MMNGEDSKKLDEEIIIKFLTNECSEDELRRVNGWLEESDENVRELFRIEELYHLGKLNPQSEAVKVEKAERALLKRLEAEEAGQRKVCRMPVWLHYAAIFVGFLLISGFGYHFYHQYNEANSLIAITSNDEIKELLLPDGTKVWLNKHTTLKHPREFSGKGRSVYVDGEAYFDVARDLHKPFIVKSDVMQVRVLGTVFNLKSNRVNHSAVATLVKGEIEVKGNNEEGMIILSPGQKAELNGVTRRLVVKQVDTGIEKWHTNEFDFNKADIFTVARTLENSYDVKIILSPAMDGTKTYSGPLKKKDTLEEMLKQVQNSIPLEYKIVGNSVFLYPPR